MVVFHVFCFVIQRGGRTVGCSNGLHPQFVCRPQWAVKMKEPLTQSEPKCTLSSCRGSRNGSASDYSNYSQRVELATARRYESEHANVVFISGHSEVYSVCHELLFLWDRGTAYGTVRRFESTKLVSKLASKWMLRLLFTLHNKTIPASLIKQ